MAFITVSQAINASPGRWSNRSVAEGEVKKVAKAASSTYFDVFLSHAYEHPEVISGVKIELERFGLKVYVDWIEGAELDREPMVT